MKEKEEKIKRNRPDSLLAEVRVVVQQDDQTCPSTKGDEMRALFVRCPLQRMLSLGCLTHWPLFIFGYPLFNAECYRLLLPAKSAIKENEKSFSVCAHGRILAVDQRLCCEEFMRTCLPRGLKITL